MEWGNTLVTMVQNIMANGKMISNKVSEFKFLMMDLHIKDILLMVKNKDRGNLFGKIHPSMKEILWIIILKEKENISGKMEEYI